jgi:hypothetical protein
VKQSSPSIDFPWEFVDIAGAPISSYHNVVDHVRDDVGRFMIDWRLTYLYR